MPNTRRRRFSVRESEVTGRELKLQNALQASHSDPDPDSKLIPPNVVTTKSSKSKHKVFPNSSKYSNMQLVSDNASSSAVSSVKKSPYRTMDKDVAASSSNIDLFNEISYEYPFYAGRSKSSATGFETQKKTMPTEKKEEKREHSHPRARTPTRRDKFPRQHRIKVRSPKRRVAIMEQPSKPVDPNSRSIGTTAIDWGVEIELFSVDDIADLIESTEDDERISTHSYDDMCRICHGGSSLSQELGSLISACSCRGTVGRVHVKCLERWLTESGKSRCELCGTRYVTRRVHKYGVPRALVMWVLSHNAKQLMVDSLGIMLMSPLAVLAAWLSGRTLAGLMTQESQITPWPLASTFVLACMTLVCYYCWIVSAATRHALGWWIWYRSQYEVRLQFQETEEQT